MLVRLRTFVEVYRQRSISAAARALDLTQPAVSQHIASLESAIGRQLFERHALGVTPTAAAGELAAEIGDGLDLAEAALATARARSVDMAGAVRIIGLADFLSEKITPMLVPLLQAGMRMRLQTANHEAVVESLIEGHCDLGITHSPNHDRRLRSERVHSERVVAVASPAVAARIAAADDLLTALTGEPLLAYNLEQVLIDGWLETNRLRHPPVSPALVSADLRGLRALLQVGYGWTALPAYLCAAELARGDLAEIAPPVGPSVNHYYLVWAPAALRQPRIALARQTLMSLLQDGVPGASPTPAQGVHDPV
jgi:DNA-binding transcriptional LysR family regulator